MPLFMNLRGREHRALALRLKSLGFDLQPIVVQFTNMRVIPHTGKAHCHMPLFVNTWSSVLYRVLNSCLYKVWN